MRFTINLSTRTYIDHRLVNRVFVALMALLFLWLAWNVSRIASQAGDLRRLTAENATMDARLNSKPAGISEGDFKRLLASIKFYNGVIERKTRNWLGVLEQLELATPDGISLVSVLPDASGEVKLEGRAKSFAQIRSYLEKLEDSKAFTTVLLLSHQETSIGDKAKGLHFSISCRVVKQ